MIKQLYLAILCLLISQYCTAQTDDYAIKKPDNNNVKVYAPKVPNAYTLFGEKVPLEQQDVRERMDRELVINTYMQGTTVQIIKQTKRWFPLIEERLKANGIPDDFKYLAVAESALLATARSGAGAVGTWQFLKSTGLQYGLEINDQVDERMNVLKSTDAACAYLRDAYNRLGNWTAAAASYNCGMGGFNSAATNQGTYNFYNLWLPDETMRYIYRILALKYLLENPTRSGFMLGDADTYKPFNARKVEVNYSIASLIQFAKEQGTTYKMIRTLNPWLRDKYLPNKSGKLYEILVPNE
jgi:membrane-bound lytic murein transglycosylase D